MNQLRDGCLPIESLRAIIQEPFLLLSADFCIRAANRAFAELANLPLADVEGQPLFSIDNGRWHVPALRTLQEQLAQMDDSASEEVVETRLAASSAQALPLQARACRYGSDGSILLTLIPTAAREAQSRVDRESILRSVIDQSGALVAALDREFRVLLANEEYQHEFMRIFGVPIQRGMNFLDALSHLPQEQENARAVWRRALHGEEFTITQSLGDADRERNVYEITYRSLRDQTGTLVGAVHYVRNVTQQHQAERERARLFQLSKDLFCVASVDGYFRQLNPAWEETLGYSREELMGQPFLHFVHPDDRDRTEAELKRIVRGRPIQHFENRYRHKDGSYRWLSWTIAPPDDDDRIYATARDVTDQKKADEMRRAMATAQMGTWELDLATLEVERSVSLDEIFGLPADGSVRTLDDYIERIHPDDRERFQQTFARTLEEKGDHAIEYRIVHPDGSIRWVSSRGTILLDESGEPIRKMGALTDITEQKQTEEALRLSEERFRIALQNAPMVVFNQDRDLRYTWIYNNPPSSFLATEEAVDPDQTVLGLRDSEIMADPAEAQVLESLKHQVLETGERLRQEIRITGRQTPTHIYDLTLEPLRNDRGEIVGITGAAIDVTEHRRTQMQLEERAQQQAVIAEVGQQALSGIDLATLMQNVVVLLAETLDVDYCKVLELLPDGESLLLRAGVGWKSDYPVGEATVSAGLESQAGYTLLSAQPVVVDDLRQETRFTGPPLLRDHDVISGMSVVIGGRDRPYGVLGVHTRRHRRFSKDQVNFLRSVAHLLAMVVERDRAQREQARLLTEVRTAHAEAEYERRRLQHLFMDAPAFICVLDGPDHVFEMANPLYYEFVDRRHLIGRTFEDVFPELEEQGVLELLDRVYETGEPFVGREMRAMLRSNGGDSTREVYTNFVLRPIVDASGQITGVFVHGVDVTEQVRARHQIEALAADREHTLAQLQGIIDSMSEGLITVAPDGTLQEINAAARALYEISALPQLPRHREEYQALYTVHAPDGELLAPAEWPMSRALRQEKFRNYEVRVRNRETGNEWIGSFSGTPVFDRQGTFLFSILTIRDVTEQKHAEQALRKSEARFRVMAETLPDILFTCHPDGTVDYLNRRFWDYTGIEPDEALGRGWISVIHEEDVQQYRQEWLLSLVEGLPFENEFRVRTRHGAYRWFVGRAHPIHDDHGQITRWVGTCTDIHDQKVAEEALRRSEKQLRLFNEMLDERVRQRTQQVRELASALTLAEQRERRRVSQILHDHVQQMLYGIQMRNHLLKLDVDQPEMVRGHVESMEDLVEQAIRSTRSLSVELSPPVLKNEGLAAALQWLASNMAEIHGLRVETDLQGDYQPANEDLRVLVFQIVRELLFNVVKHADVQTAALTMQVQEDRITVQVIDRGKGFDASDEPRHRKPDRGFGLYSIQERLALFGGHFSIETEPGHGTIGTVVVPLHPSMPAYQGQHKGAQQPATEM